MSSDIPDVEEFNPNPELESASKYEVKPCPKLDSNYSQLKEKIITAMVDFKDPNKNMVHVQLTHLPSTKLIKEIESKNFGYVE